MAVESMQTEGLKEVLSELFTLLENLETTNAAVLQFLRDEGIATDKRLSPYLQQAGRASNVKWIAARRRMEHLLTPIQKEASAGEKSDGKRQERGPDAEEHTQKGEGKPEPAEALDRAPVQSPAGPKAGSEAQAAGQTAGNSKKTDTGKTAKASIGSSEQGNANPTDQKRKT